MKRRGIFSWIYPPYIAAFLVLAAAFAVFSAQAASRFFADLSSLELSQTARLAANSLSPLLASGAPDASAVQDLCEALADGSDLRITVISPEGRVIADTEARAGSMDIHLDREEIREALSSGTGSGVRKSATTGIPTFYESRALRGPDGGTIAVVRVSMPFSIIGSRRSRLISAFAAFGLALAAAASAVAYFIARSLSAPIKRIHSGALAFASGRLSERIPEAGPREAADLARVLNQMAAELSEKLSTIREQKDEAEAILNGMSEAVAVIGPGLELVSGNRAFDRLFGRRADKAPGSARPTLLEATRSAELCDFMDAAIRAKGPLETGIGVYEGKARQLRAVSSPLDGGKAVLVLSDLTRVQRLETVRRDFTANVSHELKTPITAIRAALETIRDEGFGDAESSGRFLDMALRGAARLETILDDLLSLARIEEEEREGLEFKRVGLDAVIASALAPLSDRAAASGLRVSVEGERGLAVMGHEGLLIQALFNLADNAVKYAASGGVMTVSANVENGKAVLSVSDRGPGIPERDRSRLFERFYRVDKARSRDSGGTGLGLSIVKHIALAHSGTVRLESAEGSGSTFSVILPLA